MKANGVGDLDRISEALQERRAKLAQEITEIDAALDSLARVHNILNTDGRKVKEVKQEIASRPLAISTKPGARRRGRPPKVREVPDDDGGEEPAAVATKPSEAAREFVRSGKPIFGPPRRIDPDDEIPPMDLVKDFRLDAPPARILKFLERVGASADVHQISAVFGLSKIITNGVLKTLHDYGYVYQSGAANEWGLSTEGRSAVEAAQKKLNRNSGMEERANA